MTEILNKHSISSKLTATTRAELVTHKGMAHLASTGPAGRTCRECAHWDFRNATYRVKDGQLSPARCFEFSRLSGGRKGQLVPNDAEACKYFDVNPKAPKRFHRG